MEDAIPKNTEIKKSLLHHRYLLLIPVGFFLFLKRCRIKNKIKE
ncbi:MAG TPA: hypothetical protein PK864_07855 [Syntrophorhabdaceae bacterium]|nr:hypothetical protein [Syntrophorhabdaceae bacterium]HON85929.1 hypothetical protein [Syntrophorhabdaceae bacterium]HOT42418.1 hypothetical protein [Syntrophorhabdaceae bacterium]HPC67255.1 hypothetical protein [Syntrophorhabdaceae bacterium]HPP42437.1 hypothetical protein [Syntrophorhabdaceae bacterium]